jgi:hypothetical protein
MHLENHQSGCIDSANIQEGAGQQTLSQVFRTIKTGQESINVT